MIILTSPAQILETTSTFVLDLLSKHLDAKVLFHNQRHTVQSVHAVQEIGDALQLSSNERLAVQMAAWFQNVGYIQSSRDPLKSSVEMLVKFVKQQQFEDIDLQMVKSCILAIGNLSEHHGVVEGAVHDAYWYFLSASNHIEMCDRLRGEWAHQNKKYEDLAWRDFVCSLYKKHLYVTSYGRNFLEKRKQVNYYMVLTRLYGVAV